MGRPGYEASKVCIKFKHTLALDFTTSIDDISISSMLLAMFKREGEVP